MSRSPVRYRADLTDPWLACVWRAFLAQRCRESICGYWWRCMRLPQAAARRPPVGQQDGLLPRRCFHWRCESARARLPGVARPQASSVSTPAVSMTERREKVFGPGRRTARHRGNRRIVPHAGHRHAQHTSGRSAPSRASGNFALECAAGDPWRKRHDSRRGGPEIQANRTRISTGGGWTLWSTPYWTLGSRLAVFQWTLGSDSNS